MLLRDDDSRLLCTDVVVIHLHMQYYDNIKILNLRISQAKHL